jgi:hypothetical protein
MEYNREDDGLIYTYGNIWQRMVTIFCTSAPLYSTKKHEKTSFFVKVS